MTTHILCSGTSLRRLRWLLVPILGLVLTAFALPDEPSLAPHVDPRVELVSIVCRLTGVDWPYNQNFLMQYTADIDRYFSPYKQHPGSADEEVCGERRF